LAKTLEVYPLDAEINFISEESRIKFSSE